MRDEMCCNHTSTSQRQVILFTREYKHVTQVLHCAKLQYCTYSNKINDDQDHHSLYMDQYIHITVLTRHGRSRSMKENTCKMLREKDHACFKPCIKLALILTIGWSSSPFVIEPRLSHFKVHPIPIQLWVGPPFGSIITV